MGLLSVMLSAGGPVSRFFEYHKENGMPEYSSVVGAVVSFLDCPCTYFAPMIDDDPLTEAYEKAMDEFVRKGEHFPVFVIPSDTLLETLIMNSDPDAQSNDDEWSAENVQQFRAAMLEADTSDGERRLGDLINITREVLEEPEAFESMLHEEGGVVESQDRIISWWDYDTGMTRHIVLAMIPVMRPWQIMAWLPFGGWNDCPNNESLMSIARLWYEKYGAVPAVISSDSMEFVLQSPVPENEALDLAIKHYAFCPDIIEQSDGITIPSHAEALKKSLSWPFWWD